MKKRNKKEELDMRKLFVSVQSVEDKNVEVLPVETSMENSEYYGLIREMDKKGYEQVIVVPSIMEAVLQEVLIKKGKIKSIKLYNREPLERDSFYEPPKIPFLLRLFGKKPNPEEEEAHHEAYFKKGKQEQRNIQLEQEALEGYIEAVNENPFIMKKMLSETLLCFDVQNMTVQLNGLTMTFSGNGTFHTNSEELMDILVEKVIEYFK